MSKRKYLPMAASASRRPLIPQAPVPQLPAIARAVRSLMWPPHVIRDTTRLSYHASRRIFAMLQRERELELAELVAQHARRSGMNVEVNP